MSNPFNISFGEEPINMISRENELKDIISTFENEQPETKTYIITALIRLTVMFITNYILP